MAFLLQYTGAEALEIVQDIFKEKWPTEIETAQKTLQSISRIYKKSLQESYLKFINSGCHKGTSILYFAALYLLLKQEEKTALHSSQCIKELQEHQDKYIMNLEAVENSREPEEVKRTLRQHFSRKRDEIQEKINQLICAIDVILPELVIVQPKLFDEDA